MTIIVPNVGEVAIARRFLNQVLSLHLYSNDIIPDELNTADTFVEVVGGGYISKNLQYGNWIISDNAVAINLAQDFLFTSITNAPGTVFGYYILDDSGILLWAERFPTSILPFVPVNATLIRVTPRIQVS